MQTKFFSPLCRVGLICAGALLVLPGVRVLAADTPTQADAFPVFDNYIKVSGLTPFVGGDKAAFASRSGTTEKGSGGIEAFNYATDVSKDSNLAITGHALTGADDYLLGFILTKNDVGSVDVGYKRFRTFYDGVGGFFPLTNQFQLAGPEQLHVDRGAFWATATLALPNRPVFKISYRDETRSGQKDSTEWAAIVNPSAVIVNGALVGTAAPANTPFTAPNVQNLGEHHQIIEGSMVAVLGKTTETLKATSDWVNNNDWRSYVKYPGSTVLADPTVTVLDDQQLYKANSFRVLSQTDTKINDYIALNVGLTYSHTTTTVGGEWITPAYSSTLKTVYTAVTAGNIYGGAKVDSYVGNAFLKVTPTKNLSVDLGFRDESTVTRSQGGFIITSLASTAKDTTPASFTVANDVTYSHYVDHVATPEVSLQYTGISRLTLYANYDDRVNHSGQHWINPYAASTTAGVTGVVTTASAPIGSIFFQDANQDNQDTKVGANWNVSRNLTIRAEVFRKDHQNRFIGANDYIGTASYGALYVTGYTFTGTKLSVIFKPIMQLSFTTRYQPQRGDMTVTANSVTGGTGAESPSGKVRGQMISETVNWTPTPRFYAQGNVNVVYNYIQTSYPVVPVSATTSIAVPFLNADSDYVTSSALCGLVLDKRTDVQVQGIWSQANNYNPQVATGGQPYGASFVEQSVTVGLKHKYSDRLMLEGKVGYLRRTDGTTGGFTNYHGPLAYFSIDYAL